VKLTLVYGVAGDHLIFVEESTAKELAALWRAKTWGELKRKAPRLFDEAIERLEAAALEPAECCGDFAHLGPHPVGPTQRCRR